MSIAHGKSSNEDKIDRDEPKASFDVLHFLNKIPEVYRVGSWSPLAHIILASLMSFLLLTMNDALNDFHRNKEIVVKDNINNYLMASYYFTHDNLQLYRLFFSIYCFVIVVFLCITSGVWPLLSYTVTSWNLIIIRFLSSYIINTDYGKDIQWISYLAYMTKYPSLVGACITVFVWWLFLVPIICTCLDDSDRKTKFIKFNCGFLLLNLHLLNLPIVAVEFISSGMLLSFFDLWVGYVVAFLYILFYLNVLDARGLHFYVIFTPRTWLCVITYPFILAVYYGFFHLWNHIMSSLLLQ